MKKPTIEDGVSNFSFKSYNKNFKIFCFLKAVPHLSVSSTSIYNIAVRLSIAPAHLSILIDFVRYGGNLQ
ncbi:MAG: hypothetical protein A3F72_14140 [Bacteroidetes bacterium RIFCSPLOWO2_12_FULL_35_15]|nr:MAG: hypothetical protein A3F72_14140 [Bacteroidetes bacterium RIFCSPLOWO2_12_FULL_35_15]